MARKKPWALRSSLAMENLLPWRFTRGLEERNTAALRSYYDTLACATRSYRTGEDFPGFEVHSILGHRHVGMALWSVKSFLHYAAKKYTVVLHDDGSLQNGDIDLLRSHLPGVRIISRQAADREMRRKLVDYPNLHQYRFTELCTSDHRGHAYNMFLWALILLDFHLLSDAAKIMVMDVDVLFFRHPSEIVSWIGSPDDRRVLYSVEAYKPYRDKSNRRCYTSKPARTLNSGLLCLDKRVVADLTKIDHWVGENPDLMYTSPVFEQLCYSYLVRKYSDSTELDPALYSFNYTSPESIASHFGIKRLFFENIERIEAQMLKSKQVAEFRRPNTELSSQ